MACCFAFSCLYAPDLRGQDDIKRQISDIRKSLQQIGTGLEALRKPAPIPKVVPAVEVRVPVAPPSPPEVPAVNAVPVEKVPVLPEEVAIPGEAVQPSPVQLPAAALTPETPVAETPEEKGISHAAPLFPRNYFIPFVALTLPVDGDWTSEGSGKFDLEEGNGFSAGFRLGREFSWGLLEFEMKGFRNSYRSLALPYPDPPLVSGSASGGSMLGNFGGRLALTEKTSLFAGFGLGLAYLKSRIKVGAPLDPKPETGTTFAYQCFLGFEHAFSQQLETFLRYKFFGTTDLDRFSGRRLHELEVGLGFLF